MLQKFSKSKSGLTPLYIISGGFVLLFLISILGVVIYSNYFKDEEENESEEISFDFEVVDFANSNYSFSYPAVWQLKDEVTFNQNASQKFTFVYSVDPEIQEVGQFNDNINVLLQDKILNVSTEECNELADFIVSSVENAFESSELEASEVKTINDKDVCFARINQSNNGFDYSQDVYLFPGEEEFYTITLTYDDKDSLELAESVVYTFNY